jgi:hypothetical protein
MPKQDATITLVDEKDEEFDTNYLAYKKGLSGGWAGFALYHAIQDGDSTVFQLIKPTTFKVLYAFCAILNNVELKACLSPLHNINVQFAHPPMNLCPRCISSEQLLMIAVRWMSDCMT